MYWAWEHHQDTPARMVYMNSCNLQISESINTCMCEYILVLALTCHPSVRKLRLCKLLPAALSLEQTREACIISHETSVISLIPKGNGFISISYVNSKKRGTHNDDLDKWWSSVVDSMQASIFRQGSLPGFIYSRGFVGCMHMHTTVHVCWLCNVSQPNVTSAMKQFVSFQIVCLSQPTRSITCLLPQQSSTRWRKFRWIFAQSVCTSRYYRNAPSWWWSGHSSGAATRRRLQPWHTRPDLRVKTSSSAWNSFSRVKHNKWQAHCGSGFCLWMYARVSWDP